MEPEFWHQRWARQQIGFHQQQVNPYLKAYWPGSGIVTGGTVFVPLCGKSLDMAWLAQAGFQVLGVELSEPAVQAFFNEQGWQPQVRERAGFKVYSYGRVAIWCGDFFAMTAEDLGSCAGVWDRAALIAWPPALREAYASHLSRILPPGCRGLLVTLDYPQACLAGPPFAVSDACVEALLGKDWVVEPCGSEDILQYSPKFLAAGCSYLEERTYRVRRR